jgi:hypothetical protein
MTGRRLRVDVVGTGRIAGFVHRPSRCPSFDDGVAVQPVGDAIDLATRARRSVTVEGA